MFVLLPPKDILAIFDAAHGQRLSYLLPRIICPQLAARIFVTLNDRTVIAPARYRNVTLGRHSIHI